MISEDKSLKLAIDEGFKMSFAPFSIKFKMTNVSFLKLL